MIRLIFIILFIGFILWIISPFLKNRQNKKKITLNEILETKKNINFNQNFLPLILTVGIVLIIIIWVFPRIGINTFAIIQKILTFASALRGLLPI